MSLTSQIQNKKLNQKNNVLFGLNPAVVKNVLANTSKQALIEQGLLIAETLSEPNLSANERSCLLSLYQFCKKQYKQKFHPK